jgi:hypothetical protein
MRAARAAFIELVVEHASLATTFEQQLLRATAVVLQQPVLQLFRRATVELLERLSVELVQPAEFQLVEFEQSSVEFVLERVVVEQQFAPAASTAAVEQRQPLTRRRPRQRRYRR